MAAILNRNCNTLPRVYQRGITKAINNVEFECFIMKILHDKTLRMINKIGDVTSDKITSALITSNNYCETGAETNQGWLRYSFTTTIVKLFA